MKVKLFLKWIIYKILKQDELKSISSKFEDLERNHSFGLMEFCTIELKKKHSDSFSFKQIVIISQNYDQIVQLDKNFKRYETNKLYEKLKKDFPEGFDFYKKKYTHKIDGVIFDKTQYITQSEEESIIKDIELIKSMDLIIKQYNLFNKYHYRGIKKYIKDNFNIDSNNKLSISQIESILKEKDQIENLDNIEIEISFKPLFQLYPDGISLFCSRDSNNDLYEGTSDIFYVGTSINDLNKKISDFCSVNKLQDLDIKSKAYLLENYNLIRRFQYECIENYYPKGLEIFANKTLKTVNYRYHEKIFQKIKLIKSYQEKYDVIDIALRVQNSLNVDSILLKKKYMPYFKHQNYNLTYEDFDLLVQEQRLFYQFYPMYYCLSDLDFSLLPNMKRFVEYANNLNEMKSNIDQSILQNIISFLDELLTEHSSLKFGIAFIGNDDIYDFHWRNFVNEINYKFVNKGFSILRIEDLKQFSNQNPVVDGFIIISHTICNNDLFSISKNLLNNINTLFFAAITIVKEYSEDEALSLINDKQVYLDNEKKAKIELEEQRVRENEEKKRKERDVLERKERDKNEISVLRNRVSKFEDLITRNGNLIKYLYFYNYYPKSVVEVSEADWEIRRLIWDFKDGKDYARSRVSSLLIDKLKSLFTSQELSNLTLVCAPASKIQVNINRFMKFADSVCTTLDMYNAFDEIEITSERESTHTTNNRNIDRMQYLSFNANFFNGKKVIIFDDVVTRGDSMTQLANKLNSMGAIVICSLSIGRTKHQREEGSINSRETSSYHQNTNKNKYGDDLLF